MSDESAMIKSVIRKLSALRATMSTEEQLILDSVVIRHAEDEVVAHGMDLEATVRRSEATVRARPEEDEVVAHGMDAEATVRKATVREATVRYHIIFNSAEGEYQVNVK